MDRDKLLNHVKTLHLNIDNDVIDELILEWDYINNALKHLKTINVKGIKPMTRIGEESIFILREDTPKITFDKYLFLKNAPKIKNDYILLKKMENNE